MNEKWWRKEEGCAVLAVRERKIIALIIFLETVENYFLGVANLLINKKFLNKGPLVPGKLDYIANLFILHERPVALKILFERL
jgi:hypothetical protein